jgi:hypothetical protein
MKVHEAEARLCELLRTKSMGHLRARQGLSWWARTSINRFAPGFIWVYCVMFPSGIHGLMMHSGYSVSETSITGSTFGCEIGLRSLVPEKKFWYGVH